MKGRNEVAPRPWLVQRRLFSDSSFGFFLPGGVTTAEAQLIVAAVNSIDRLRAIEDAARTLAEEPAGSATFWNELPRLRAALGLTGEDDR